MSRLAIGLCSALLVVACSKKDKQEEAKPVEPTAVEPTPAAEPTAKPAAEATPEEGLAAAKKGAKTLGKTLQTNLGSAMQKSGPVGAMQMCADDAAKLTAAVASPRLRVGRSTLRLRNPKNVEAPEWVKTWLTESGERKAEGLAGVEEVVDGTARFLKPLAVNGLCLTCHGDAATQPPEMKELLASRYPEDKAVGYEVGDLRGALWAEYDLKAP